MDYRQQRLVKEGKNQFFFENALWLPLGADGGLNLFKRIIYFLGMPDCKE